MMGAPKCLRCDTSPEMCTVIKEMEIWVGINTIASVQTLVCKTCGYESVIDRSRDHERGSLYLLSKSAPKLLHALESVRTAWKSIPETSQVPDEINNEELWELVDSAIAEAKRPTQVTT